MTRNGEQQRSDRASRVDDLSPQAAEMKRLRDENQSLKDMVIWLAQRTAKTEWLNEASLDALARAARLRPGKGD